MGKVKLKEVCQIIMGQSPKGKSYNNQKLGLPLLNGAADYKGQLFKPKQFTSNPTKIAEEGDIIFGIRATIGNFAFADNKYCIGRGIAALRVDEEKASKDYILKVVKREIEILKEIASGSTIKGIKKEDLTEMELVLPPLENQKHIAQILDDAATLRDKTKQLLKEYDGLAQSIFLEMFGDPVRNKKGWESKTLKDVCTKITDGTHDTPQRLTEGVKFITGKHIRPFKIDYENSDYVTEEVHQEIYRRCNPEYGDILYTNIGVNFGTAAMNTVDYEFSMKNVALLKYDRIFLNGRYLESLLNNENFKDRLKKVFGIGGAQQFLSLSTNLSSIIKIGLID